jgi:predicted DNA-binding protein
MTTFVVAMAIKLAPTSIRLAAKEKRRIAAAARKQGVTSAKFIKQAALERAASTGGMALAAITASLRELIEEEVDAAIALDRIARRKAGEGRLYTGEEAWRELGL